MNREIKFKVWDNQNKVMYDVEYLNFNSLQVGVIALNQISETEVEQIQLLLSDNFTLVQFTGLKDKNGKGTCIYEQDILSLDGKVIGNYYENANLLKEETNLLIQGFGTKEWLTTYQKAVDRGCSDSQ